MREYSFALGTAASAFVLVIIGGLVHASGSSLACPGWPFCTTEPFPPLEGGVLFQQGHRGAALAVAALTAWLAREVWRSRADPRARSLAAAAVALVCLQAALGAAAVLLRLPPVVSSAHLALSLAFLATLVALAHRLRPAGHPRAAGGPRALLALAALAAYAQMVLGGVVRHGGAALACGPGVPLCGGALWPAGAAAQLHLAHRLLGMAVAALVVGAAWRAAAAALRDGAAGRALLAFGAPALVLAQVALGFWTVVSGVHPRVVTGHLALGALLLADLVVLYLSLEAPRRDGVGAA
jgi:cytochrome c oxidase assembly protein subunit 15